MDWDVVDLTSHIFLELDHTRYTGRIVDHVYVDEVQGLTPAQMALFKYICRNPHGFVFAGDTAQTISAGVGFRFESVRDLFYKDILPYIDPTLASKAQLVPDLEILTHNYRTHSGVLNLACSIVEMLYKFFPSMVDKLPREDPLVSGPKPMFLEDTSIDELIVKLFGKGDTAVHEFGAEQAIIVRNEVIKEKIAKQIEGALVLTVFEAKGLEFEDVLCFNFFSDSPFSKWRVLCGFDPETSLKEAYPEFSDEKHRMLCSELKSLYVVITRCKRKLWFYDENKDEKRKPALEIWTSQGLIKTMSTELKSQPLAQKSTPEQWNRLGKELFERRLLKDAQKCFMRSGDQRYASLCEALIIEAEAEVLGDKGKTAESWERYASAAAIYEKIQEHDRATHAYMMGQRFVEASRIFVFLHKYENALDACSKKKPNASGQCKAERHEEALRILGTDGLDLTLKDLWGENLL